MDDETKKDGSESQMEAIPGAAEAGDPTAQSEAPAEAGRETRASTEEGGSPGEEAPMSAAEMDVGATEAGGGEEAAGAAEPAAEAELASGPENEEEQVIESVAEGAVELDLAEPARELSDEPTAGAGETPVPQTPEAEASPAPAMAVEAGEVSGVASQVEAEPAETAEAEDDRHWYVVHCYSGYENKVRHNLEQRIESMGMKDKIFDVVVPTEEEIEVKEGKRRTVERRVFPGYILVQMIMTEESWYVVRNTPGVTGFVGMGNEPTPLRPEEVAQIIRRMEAEAPRVKVTYKIDQKVRIIDGPFNDFIGTVDDIDMERAKVRVMVSFFGRETPVELDFLQVEKA
jgi:transcriptional antiterminator NusG